MRNILIAAGGIAIAAGAIVYLRNKKSKQDDEERDNVNHAKNSKHLTQVFSKAKALNATRDIHVAR